MLGITEAESDSDRRTGDVPEWQRLDIEGAEELDDEPILVRPLRGEERDGARLTWNVAEVVAKDVDLAQVFGRLGRDGSRITSTLSSRLPSVTPAVSG